MAQLVYILTNPAFSGLVKIGFTTQKLEKRMKALSSTGVPSDFKCYYCHEVKDCQAVEKKLHNIFDITFIDGNKKEHKVRMPRKEFFRIHPKTVKAVLELFPGKEHKFGKDIKILSGQNSKNRRKNFTFPMVGINKGAVLTFIWDDTKKAKVVDDKKIKIPGIRAPVTLSGITLKLLKKHFGYKGSSVRGSDYWVFGTGTETLTDRRERMEKSLSKS